MPYRQRDHLADIRHEQLCYKGKHYSPSQFACHLADNTSRNAWRDIWIKRPNDKDWILADSLRRA